MPLTAFQREVLRAIAVNRSVQSHVAGGLVLNAGAGYAVQRRLWEARFRRAWVERGGASNT